ncbi:hypothetical protein RJ55_01186 [Drechmeria coniospora]|nr:hypothetical protein RJ55_01186 [Drechmeria coniospora]
MSQFKEIIKNGWHPEKEGTTIRGQVSGLVGRKSAGNDRSNHVSRPLSELKDASTFAPPPRRVGTPGAPSPSPPIRSPPATSASASGRQQGSAEPPPPPPRRPGAVHGNDGESSSDPGGSASRSLPPRLPPRENASPGSGHLPRGAVDRLGAAGVSVPGLGIGRSGPASSTPPSLPPPPRTVGASAAMKGGLGSLGTQVNALQSRLSTADTSTGAKGGSAGTTGGSTGGGTTWAQKQAALKTASAFHKDPSSVSFSDAKAAASTANNFRQRHGDQVAAGIKSASELDQKYGVRDKVGAYASDAGQDAGQASGQGRAGSESATASLATTLAGAVPGLAGKKKPPPPPPPKRAGVAAAVNGDTAPPVPTSTRPTY